LNVILEVPLDSRPPRGEEGVAVGAPLRHAGLEPLDGRRRFALLRGRDARRLRCRTHGGPERRKKKREPKNMTPFIFPGLQPEPKTDIRQKTGHMLSNRLAIPSPPQLFLRKRSL